MKVKRFYGDNIRSALNQVSETFGEEAAILSTQKIADGVEVIAALDYDEKLLAKTAITNSNGERAESEQSEMSAAIQANKTNESVSFNKNNTKEQRLSNNGNLAEDFSQHQQFSQELEETELVNNDLNNQHSVIESLSVTHNSESHTTKNSYFESNTNPENNNSISELPTDPSLSLVKQELSLMRNMMNEQLKGMAWNQFAEKSPHQVMLVKQLSALGFNSFVINEMLPHIKNSKETDLSWSKLLALLVNRLPIKQTELLKQGGIYCFLGATGVGKTTTIAKIAAQFVLQHGADSVALISTDNYRISAQEQLNTFAHILNLPTIKTGKQMSLNKALEQYADKKLILIDTAGFSTKDELFERQLKVINQCDKEIQRVFLMSAASQQQVLQHCFDLFSPFKLDACVMTKIDEATSLGEALSVVVEKNIPLLYTTHGQKVPNDIAPAKGVDLIAKSVSLSNRYKRVIDEWDMLNNIEYA